MISFPGKAGLLPAFRAAAQLFEEFSIHHALIPIPIPCSSGFHAQHFSTAYSVCTERDDIVSFCVTHLHVVGFSSLCNNTLYSARESA